MEEKKEQNKIPRKPYSHPVLEKVTLTPEETVMVDNCKTDGTSGGPYCDPLDGTWGS